MKILCPLLAATVLAVSAPCHAQTVAEAQAVNAAELPNPPVIAGDIKDRPYTVLGQITAGVRKATAFSKAASPEKIYRELWERGQKLGADAVIHASYGASHISAMSWGQTNATGVAIKFTGPAAGKQ
ncbi:hypothetical protein [Novosphingobium terrae]|uniref:hypothetical protein n=1 Tax=Novosphingobium terrae TaxID=2726189 RepID=UPI00198121C8|nr:hypothetical protein [Novosphingobium terrae]